MFVRSSGISCSPYLEFNFRAAQPSSLACSAAIVVELISPDSAFSVGRRPRERSGTSLARSLAALSSNEYSNIKLFKDA